MPRNPRDAHALHLWVRIHLWVQPVVETDGPASGQPQLGPPRDGCGHPGTDGPASGQRRGLDIIVALEPFLDGEEAGGGTRCQHPHHLRVAFQPKARNPRP